MIRKCALLLSILIVAACQQDASVESSGSSVSARVQLSSGSSVSAYEKAVWVRIHLVAGSFQQTTTRSFSSPSCSFTGVPVDVPFSLSYEGLSLDSVRLWSGFVTGQTAASGGGEVVANVIAQLVRDTTLTSLGVDIGTGLQPAFSKGVRDYSTTIPAGSSSISLRTAASDSGDTVRCNGASCSNIAITHDTTPVLVRVSNLYGDTLTYNLSVYRAPGPPASDSSLAALSVTPGVFSEPFDASRLRYVDSVLPAVTTVDVNATARTSDDVAKITYNGSASSRVALGATGNTDIAVAVTNKNGNVLTYIVTVARKGPTLVARDSLLASLSTSPGVFVESFDDSRFAYTDSVDNAVSSVTVNAAARTPSDTSGISYSGGNSNLVALNATGTTSIPVVVTNRNGNSQTYTITVARRAAVPVARDTMLSSLSTTPGRFGEAFDSLRTDYTDSVEAGVSSIVVTATASRPGDVSGITCAGSASNIVALTASGSTVVPVVVTNSNGHSRIYTITVVKKALPDLSSPVAVLQGGGRDTLVPLTTTSFQVAWKVTDNALKSVTISGTLAVGTNDMFAKTVSLSGDSTWIKLVAIDSSGNTTRDSILVRKPKDLTPPQVTFTKAKNRLVPNSTIADTLVWTVTDNSGVVHVTVNGASVAGSGSTYSYVVPALTVGVHRYIMVATDSFANSDTDMVVVSRTALPPLHSLASGRYTGPVYDTLSSPGADSIEYSLDSVRWTRSRGAVALNVSGIATLYARSFPGAVVSSIHIEILPKDLTPPQVTFTKAKNRLVPNSTIADTLVWTVTDNSGVVHVTVNGASVAGSGSTYSYVVPALTVGVHRYIMVATDSFANSDTDMVVVSRTALPPLHSLASGRYTGPVYDTLSSPGADSIEYSLDSVRWTRSRGAVALNVSGTATLYARSFPGAVVSSIDIEILPASSAAAGGAGFVEMAGRTAAAKRTAVSSSSPPKS